MIKQVDWSFFWNLLDAIILKQYFFGHVILHINLSANVYVLSGRIFESHSVSHSFMSLLPIPVLAANKWVIKLSIEPRAFIYTVRMALHTVPDTTLEHSILRWRTRMICDLQFSEARFWVMIDVADTQACVVIDLARAQFWQPHRWSLQHLCIVYDCMHRENLINETVTRLRKRIALMSRRLWSQHL